MTSSVIPDIPFLPLTLTGYMSDVDGECTYCRNQFEGYVVITDSSDDAVCARCADRAAPGYEATVTAVEQLYAVMIHDLERNTAPAVAHLLRTLVEYLDDLVAGRLTIAMNADNGVVYVDGAPIGVKAEGSLKPKPADTTQGTTP